MSCWANSPAASARSRNTIAPPHTSQPGYEKRLGGLQVVVGLWGQTPEDAAQPLLRLVTSDAAEFRDLTKATLVGRGIRSLLTGRLRRRNRMPMNVTVLDAHH